ncbi:MAG TPA: glycogen-binding domain-containing protein [Longimicrobiales bacterium]|nr:glycogen-binding domain-containing protein [Longimicrobiales bacterium]
MKLGRAALFAGLFLALAQPAGAQTAVSVGFGENADAATGASSGAAISIGLSHLVDVGGLHIGVGLPLESASGSRWGSIAAWMDLPDAAAGLGLLGDGRGFVYRDPILQTSAAAAAGEAQLYRAFGAGPVRLRLRGGGRAGTLSGGAATVRRALAVVGADVTLGTPSLLVRGSTDVWAAAEATYPEVSAVALASAPPLVVYGRVSRWLHDDVPGTGWGIGAELAVSDQLALVVDASRPATDILFFSPTQRSWSIGLRLGAAAPPARGLPAPVFAAPGRPIRLEVEADARAGPIRVAGTFNGWEPQPMRNAGGRWVTELRLGAGVYEYAFVAPDGSWFVPEGTPGRKPDGFGGFIATIVVQ